MTNPNRFTRLPRPMMAASYEIKIAICDPKPYLYNVAKGKAMSARRTTKNVSTSLDELAAGFDAAERKLQQHDQQIRDLEILLRQLPRQTPVSPYAPPSRPIWN